MNRRLGWGIAVITVVLLMVLISCSKKVPETTSNASNTINASNTNNESTAFEWTVAAPREMGLDETALAKIDATVAAKHGKTYSVLIVKDGRLVYEKYYQNKSQDTPTGVFSVTKSFLSALTGIAIDKGLIQSTEQKLADLLPDLFMNMDDPRKKDLTIRQALTLTGGLESVDNDIMSWFQSANWNAYTLSRPLRQEPGTTFGYNTGLPHLLSSVITKVSGMSTEEFAIQNLFGPLSITNYGWSTDKAGWRSL